VRPQSELDFLYETVTDAVGKTVGRDAAWQLAPVFASIGYSDQCIANLQAFELALAQIFPDLSNHGSKRALKAFVRNADTITKPSYIGRLNNGLAWDLPDGQRDILIERFIREPLSGGLVFSVFHPKDLIARRRPGYVPCLVSGSLLVHRHELHLNAFFRSQSIVEFGLHDLLFLRGFQAWFLRTIADVHREKFPQRMRRHYRIRPGPLNLQFARIVVPSRLARNRQGFLRRCDVVDRWLTTLVEMIDKRPESFKVTNDEAPGQGVSFGRAAPVHFRR